MVISYKNVVPWGRNLEEYTRMFNLTEKEFNKKIIGFGDGPASFNFEAYCMGYSVTSVDPVYRFSKEQLKERIDETYDVVIEQTRNNSDKFVWKTFENIEALGVARMKAMNLFVEDFEKGKSEKRYITGELPELDFEDNSFELGLCSHFLFLYSDNLSLEFHIKAISEMARIAKEVRIFPILDANAEVSVHYPEVCSYFRSKGYEVSEIEVLYEFQRGGNKMLCIGRGGENGK